MSSDDFIRIQETKNRKYDVTHEGVNGGLIEKIGTFSTLREAMIEADAFDCDNMPTEYGIKFCPYDR